MKSGYDKYLRLSKSGHLAGVSDAVGALEQFQPVWQDGRTALLAPNGKFLSVDEDDLIIADKANSTNIDGQGEILIHVNRYMALLLISK